MKTEPRVLDLERDIPKPVEDIQVLREFGAHPRSFGS